MLDPKNEDKGESPMMAILHPSHNTRYTKTKEQPVKIQNDGTRMTRARYSGELLPDQKCGGDHQHLEERGHQTHGKPDEETARISGIGGRPIRKKTPSIKYTAVEFDLT